MLFFNNFYDTLVILYVYVFIYNISLFLVFWALIQFNNTNFKTIHSFADFKNNFFLTSVISLIFFSIAGVPPFLGFFSKLLILLPLVNSNFFIFFIFFFILLFLGLYFYLQNIRFLHSTNQKITNNSFNLFLRLPLVFVYFSFFLIFFIIFGFLLIDDLILYFYWLFC